MGAKGNRNKSKPANIKAQVALKEIPQQGSTTVTRRHVESKLLDDLNYDPRKKPKPIPPEVKHIEPVEVQPPREEEQDGLIRSNVTWSPTPYSAFKLLISARFAAALWTTISDCDETFNYWEPIHYLLYGTGFQTWEYSPDYALRSYTYLLIHAVPAKIYEYLLSPTPLLTFFFIRCFLAFTSVCCEVFLYKAVKDTFGANVSRFFLLISLFSAGMYISSVALLPSSFSSYMTCIAIGSWLMKLNELAIFAVAISAFMSWPFAALVGLFIAFDIVVLQRKVKLFIGWSCLSLLVVLIPLILIDSSYYGKFVIAPLNIVLYNIFSSKGPELYGSEPWTYYFINCFLNFNVTFFLAFLTPLLLLGTLKARDIKEKYFVFYTFLLWFLVFLFQPHKEERFLFPVYPLIPLCGAISIECVQKILGNILSTIISHQSTLRKCVNLIGLLIIITSSLIGVSRILAIHYGYRAPFDIYFQLHRNPIESWGDGENFTLCYGKEWHRFPTRFFLPRLNWNVRFIESEFKGQLPNSYPPFDPQGTRRIPNFMNDMNLEEVTRYANVSECDFIIDLIDVDGKVTIKEPNFAKPPTVWKIMSEQPFLNAEKSKQFFRTFYIPWISEEYVKYDRYVLLQRTDRQPKKSKKKNKRQSAGKEFIEDDDDDFL